MHLKALVCEVLAREFYHVAARAANTTDITLFTQGLHDNPEIMRERLQREIDSVPSDRFDAIVLGYGLCNNGIAGLRAAGIPLIVPRAHDCITLFLGSKERYAAVFAERPGTYYYTSGWLEYESRQGERVGYTPASGLAKRMALQELVAKYGEENARYLADTMSQWEVHYTHGLLITFPFTAHLGLSDRVKAICAEHGWEYAELQGDLALIEAMLNGNWGEDRFLRVAPGEEITAQYDDSIIQCRKCAGCSGSDHDLPNM